MSISIISLIIIYLLNIVSTISIIFIRRNDTTGATFAWLLVFLFLPYVGFILYFFFGSTFLMRSMSRKYGMSEIEELYSKNIDKHIIAIEDKSLIFNEAETEKYRDMILLNANNEKCYYTQNNNVELLIDADEKFPRLLEDIKNAEETIEILYFIFKTKDEIGKKLLTLLTSKAKQGVKVTLIYDSIGCLKTSIYDFDELKAAGGEIYRYLPTMLSSFLHINYRMHRKIVIIDNKVAYTGGINVGDDYFGLMKINKPWRDTSVRLTGSCVYALRVIFWGDLNFLKNQSRKYRKIETFMSEEKLVNIFSQPTTIGKVGVQIVSSGPGDDHETIKDAYVKMISSAKKYVYIQTPYFVPDITLLESIRLAAESGVDVRIMLPGVPDKKYVYYVTLSYVETLLKSNVKIYFHEGFLHAKTLVIDDQVSTVGTTNMDMRSFKLDYEVNAFVYNNVFALKCRNTFERDILNSTKAELEIFSNRSLRSKFFEAICRFIAPLA